MDHKSQEAVAKTLLAGGIAGCCAKTTVAPFDRVKILLQAQNRHYRHLGVISTANTVCKHEGMAGLFKGNGAQMVRIFPYAAIQFASYEHYKRFLKKLKLPSQMDKLAAGSLAGMTAVSLTYPLDVIRARLAFQVAGENMYTGVVDAFKVILTQEGGMRALYKGIVPTMLGMAPYAGLSFYCFETLKKICIDHFPGTLGKPSSSSNNGLVLILPAKLICGGLAGAFAQTVSYPLDVARRKMQLARMLPDPHKFSNWYNTLCVVVKEDGIRKGLYRGLSVNYIKVTPMVAVSFSTYELMKQVLGLDTDR